MTRFIIVTFAFLGWAFYELSGGSDFEPGSVALTNISVDPLKVASAPADTATGVTSQGEVTRVSLNLTSVEDVLNDKTKPTQRRISETVQQVALQTTETTNDDTAILPSLVTNASAEAAVETAASVLADIRSVTGNRVNVRGGPSTDYGVVSKLVRGDEVEILEDTGNGWVRMRPVNGGPVGWMADFLLSEG